MKQFMADFGDYFEGEVAADLRREMESHLSHCRTCQVVWDSTGKTVRIVTDSGSFYLRRRSRPTTRGPDHGEDTGEPGILT